MTTLLLVRHAIAEDREIAAAAGMPDELRPLTAKGTKKMRQSAAALAQLVPDLALIASSPLRRALQTAALLAERYEHTPVQAVDALKPGTAPEAIPEWLATRRLAGPVALVGHEPDLGRWASWALCGEPRACIPLKKGGALLLTFPGLPAPGHGELVWSLPPTLLRAMD